MILYRGVFRKKNMEHEQGENSSLESSIIQLVKAHEVIEMVQIYLKINGKNKIE